MIIFEENSSEILYHNNAASAPFKAVITSRDQEDTKHDVKIEKALMMAQQKEPLFAKIDKKIFQTQPIDVHTTVKTLNIAKDFTSMHDIISSSLKDDQKSNRKSYYRLKTEA